MAKWNESFAFLPENVLVHWGLDFFHWKAVLILYYSKTLWQQSVEGPQNKTHKCRNSSTLKHIYLNSVITVLPYFLSPPN